MSRTHSSTQRRLVWRGVLSALASCVACNSLFDIQEPTHKAAGNCTLNSDCPAGSGQVCIFSRCSPPCAADVDCGGNGERCLQTDAGAACVSVESAACEDEDECPSGSACVDGGCYASCSDARPCLDGQRCEDGACKGAETDPGHGGQGAGGQGGQGVAEAGHSGAGAAGESGAGGEGGSTSESPCGNGVLDGDEKCDDTNRSSGDGCNETCRVELGWSCTQAEPSQCAPICGDGLVLGTESEAGGCDDENTDPADGCSAKCTVEASFACSGAPSTCAKTCGNGKTDEGETCDDANAVSGDGCLACQVEAGFSCDNAKNPSTCADVDECDQQTDDCDVNAICKNTVGAFNCTCKNGYEGNGKSCTKLPTVDDVLSMASSFGNPGWKDSWWVLGCGSKHDHDCYTMEPCPADGLRTTETFPIGGAPGQHYKVTFTYNGLHEGRNYTGGTKDAPLAADLVSRPDNDSFYRDGDAPLSNYNEYRLTVFDEDGVEQRHYFMNAFSIAEERHISLSSSFTKSIVIIGGGKVEHMVFDKNCHAIDNCNSGEVVGTTCAAPRRLPGSDSNLLLPPKYADPNDGYKVKDTSLISIVGTRSQPWKSQLAHLTVTAIVKTNDPVTKNY
jgi:cysteine-rich repeat protein